MIKRMVLTTKIDCNDGEIKVDRKISFEESTYYEFILRSDNPDIHDDELVPPDRFIDYFIHHGNPSDFSVSELTEITRLLPLVVDGDRFVFNKEMVITHLIDVSSNSYFNMEQTEDNVLMWFTEPKQKFIRHGSFIIPVTQLLINSYKIQEKQSV